MLCSGQWISCTIVFGSNRKLLLSLPLCDYDRYKPNIVQISDYDGLTDPARKRQKRQKNHGTFNTNPEAWGRVAHGVPESPGLSSVYNMVSHFNRVGMSPIKPALGG